MRVYETRLELAETLRDAKTQYSALRGMGSMSERRDDLDRAQQFSERRVVVAREIEQRSWLFAALGAFAAFAQERGDLALAEPLFRQDLAMTRAEGLPAHTPYALAQLGGFPVSGRGKREQGCAMTHGAAEQRHASGDVAEEDIRARMRELGCEQVA
jgi:hypothetical protein